MDFKKNANSENILAWKSKGLSDESIKPPVASNNNLARSLNYIHTKIRVKLDGSCLKQGKVTFTHKNAVSIHIAYEMNLWPFTPGQDFTLGNSLFGDAKVTKNNDFDEYIYFGYGIGFDAREVFRFLMVVGLVKP